MSLHAFRYQLASVGLQNMSQVDLYGPWALSEGPGNEDKVPCQGHNYRGKRMQTGNSLPYKNIYPI